MTRLLAPGGLTAGLNYASALRKIREHHKRGGGT